MATTTSDQDRKFGAEALEWIIDWVASNMEPEEVYGDRIEKDHKEWCENNASAHYSPNELFSTAELEDWAEDEGYVKP